MPIAKPTSTANWRLWQKASTILFPHLYGEILRADEKFMGHLFLFCKIHMPRMLDAIHSDAMQMVNSELKPRKAFQATIIVIRKVVIIS